MEYKRIHIGSIIKEEVKRQKKTLASFAESIGILKQNAEKKVFSQSGLDTNFLILISEVLNCNFFKYYHPEEDGNQNELQERVVKATLSIEFGEKKQDRSFRFVFGENNIKIEDNKITDSHEN
jgi:transcriptional regulator with XRE-family HTH domain